MTQITSSVCQPKFIQVLYLLKNKYLLVEYCGPFYKIKYFFHFFLLLFGLLELDFVMYFDLCSLKLSCFYNSSGEFYNLIKVNSS